MGIFEKIMRFGFVVAVCLAVGAHAYREDMNDAWHDCTNENHLPDISNCGSSNSCCGNLATSPVASYPSGSVSQGATASHNWHENAGIHVLRKPVTNPFEELAGAVDPECSAVYQVYLHPKYTTQGNDRGMLPPHGVDTSARNEEDEDGNVAHLYQVREHPLSDSECPPSSDWPDNPTITPEYATNEAGEQVIRHCWRHLGGENFKLHPAQSDTGKQQKAMALKSVPALTEPCCDVDDDSSNAYPVGFHSDTIVEHHAVCVFVRNVWNSWVEIMAETDLPDQHICVSDWKPRNAAATGTEPTCGYGELYVTRDPYNRLVASGNNFQYEDVFSMKFYSQMETTEFDFVWRVVSSEEARNYPGAERGPDTENWSHMRRGDDYPQSLLDPYPEDYEEPEVFARASSSASTTVSSLLAMFVAALLAWC